MRMLIRAVVGLPVFFAKFAGLWRWNTVPVLIVVDTPLPVSCESVRGLVTGYVRLKRKQGRTSWFNVD